MEALRCVVCNQSANGQHFEVVCCRACAAFFRRWLVDRRRYRCINGSNLCNMRTIGRTACKACRLRLCQIAGFKEKREFGAATNANYMTTATMDAAENCWAAGEEKVVSLSETATPNLSRLVNAYRRSRHQDIGEGGRATSVGTTEFTSNKQQIVELFDSAIRPFAAMKPAELKYKLVEDCERQIGILNYCWATLEQSVDTIRRSIRSGRSKQHKNKMQAFMEKLAMIPHRIGQHDFCAMMALLLCSKVRQLDNNNNCSSNINNDDDNNFNMLMTMMMDIDDDGDDNDNHVDDDINDNELEWSNYRETLLTEWFHHLSAAFGFKETATMQMARLIAFLPQLEDLAKCRPADTPKANKTKKNGTAATATAATIVASSRPQSSPSPTTAFAQDARELHQLCQLLSAHRRIWGSFHELQDAYQQKFAVFEDLLESPDNILSTAGQFSPNPPLLTNLERSMFLSEVNAMDSFSNHPRTVKNISVNRLLSVGLLKALPVYRQFSTEEKAILVRHQSRPISQLLYSFYSACMGRNTHTGADGLSSFELYSAVKRFAADPQYMKLAENATCMPVAKFLRIELPSPEEMAILLAINSSYPSIPELSEDARELLYTEQVRYSRLLWRHLQRQLGPDSGAKRYAELLFVLESAHFSVRQLEMFITYTEAFHLRKHYNAGFPQSIAQLV